MLGPTEEFEELEGCHVTIHAALDRIIYETTNDNFSAARKLIEDSGRNLFEMNKIITKWEEVQTGRVFPTIELKKCENCSRALYTEKKRKYCGDCLQEMYTDAIDSLKHEKDREKLD